VIHTLKIEQEAAQEKEKKNLQISAAVQRGEAVQIFLFWINLTLVLVHPRSHFWPQEIPRAFYISIL
jgi:hypothetical protein